MARKLKIDTGGAVFGPYSPGITVKDHIWLSGQVDISVDGIEAQTHGTLAKVDGLLFFFFQAEDGIRNPLWSRGLGEVYKRRVVPGPTRGGERLQP